MVICTLLPLYVLVIVCTSPYHVSPGCATCGTCPLPGPAVPRACPSPNLPFTGTTHRRAYPSSGRLSRLVLPRACPLSGRLSSVRPSPGRNSMGLTFKGLPFHGPTFPWPPFPGAAFRLPFLYRDRIVPSFARHLLTTRSLSDVPVAVSPFFGTVCLP